MRSQTTLFRSVGLSGKGLHSGEDVSVVLHPAEPGTGLAFYRTDVGTLIPAVAEEAGRLDYATSLGGDGRSVGTVEHLLSAVVGLGIDNLLVEIDGPEVPILDGSALPWVRLLREAGLVRQGVPTDPIRLDRTITVPSPAGKSIEIRPSRELRVTYSIDFPHPAIGKQTLSLVISPDSFERHLAPARTFGFLAEYELMKSRGLARGANAENCIVFGATDVENGPLRFADELVRHKALDLLGDLALVGRPVIGHVVAHRAGHALHSALAGAIRRHAAEAERLAAPERVAALAPALALS